MNQRVIHSHPAGAHRRAPPKRVGRALVAGFGAAGRGSGRIALESERATVPGCHSYGGRG